MYEDEIRVLKAQIIDLNTKVKNLRAPNRMYEFILFVLLILSVVGSSFYVITSVNKQVVKSSVINSNSIKKQIREYHEF